MYAFDDKAVVPDPFLDYSNNAKGLPVVIDNGKIPKYINLKSKNTNIISSNISCVSERLHCLVMQIML